MGVIEQDSEKAPPPFMGNGCYFGGDDHLRCTALNALASVTLRIAGRFLHADGRIEPFVHRLVPTSDRVASVQTFTLGVGWLLSAQVSISAAAPLTGQTFAVLSIVRGRTGAVEDVATLTAGYVSAANKLNWPGSPVLNSIDGRGNLRQIAGTTPGAGAEVLETVPAGARWELLALRIILTTGVAVANRQVALTFDDGGAPLFATVEQSNTNLVASTTNVVTFAPGFPTTVGNRFITVALPIGLQLAAGFRFRTVSLALQAADQYSGVAYLVREWLEGA